MQGLLTDIELDLQELKCLTEAFQREPNATMRGVLRRTISQMQGRLSTMLEQLESAESSPVLVEKYVQEETAPVTNILPKTEATRITVETSTVEVETTVEPAEPVETSTTTETSGFAEVNEVFRSLKEEPVGEVFVEPSTVLGERIRTAVDLRKSISLNDSFRFSRELFDNDAERMNRILHQISEMSSYAAALSLLSSIMTIDKENEAMNDLLEQLNKYFNTLD